MGLTSTDVSIAYTIMTFVGIGSSLFIGGCVIDRLQRKSIVVSLAVGSSCAASALLVLANDYELSPWATTVGFGLSLGMMSGCWEICYGILLADVFVSPHDVTFDICSRGSSFA